MARSLVPFPRASQSRNLSHTRTWLSSSFFIFVPEWSFLLRIAYKQQQQFNRHKLTSAPTNTPKQHVQGLAQVKPTSPTRGRINSGPGIVRRQEPAHSILRQRVHIVSPYK